MRKTRKRRPRRSPAQWELLVNAWREGTGSTEDFCARHDISESTLYRWHARLGSGGQDASGQALRSEAFVPVRVVNSPESPPEPLPEESPPKPSRSLNPENEGYLEIVAANGRVVRVWGEVAEGALSRVLAVVEQC